MRQRLLAVVVYPRPFIHLADVGKRIFRIRLGTGIERSGTALAPASAIAIPSHGGKGKRSALIDFPVHIQVPVYVPVLSRLVAFRQGVLVPVAQVLLVIRSELAPVAGIAIIDITRHIQTFLHLFRSAKIDRVQDIIFISGSEVAVGRTCVYHKVIPTFLKAHHPSVQVTPLMGSVSGFGIGQ